MSLSKERLKEIYDNDKFATGCGIKIIESSPGYAKCAMKVTDKHINGLGTIMGGAVFTLADYTFSVAANNHGNIAVSLNAFISFIRACKEGTLYAVATETSRTRSTGIYQVTVTDESGNIIASVTGTCYFKTKS